MSGKLSDVTDHSDNIYFCTSGYLVAKLTEFRNGTIEMGCLETFARRVVGEIGYAALAVAALVETVVKAILFVPGILIACCLPESYKTLSENIIACILGGLSFAAPVTLIALTSLVQNVYRNEMSVDDVIPCLKDSPAQIFDGAMSCFVSCIKGLGSCLEACDNVCPC